jgi:hypothetical protein
MPDMARRDTITHVKTSDMAIMIIGAATHVKTSHTAFVIIGAVYFVVSVVMARVVARPTGDRPVGLTVLLFGAGAYLVLLGVSGALSGWFLVPGLALWASAFLVWLPYERRRRAARNAAVRDQGGFA